MADSLAISARHHVACTITANDNWRVPSQNGSSISQRFSRSLVKHPVTIRDCRVPISKIDIADILRACSLLLLILMAIAFFAGCASNPGADPDSVIQKKERKIDAYGEVGAGYGRHM